ncbi:SocA family protein [bacterium]|nr:SocA family protein [bacterium]MBU1752256.1 SocA family protein [bacterium]
MNIKKITTVLCYLSNKLGAIDKLKTIKLLYYIDKQHLLEYGRFITNDTYVKMPYGPVPTKILDIINEPEINLFDEDKKYFNEYISIQLDDRKRTITSKKIPDITELSKSEIKTIENILSTYGDYKGGELIDITHQEKAWQNAAHNDNLAIEDMISELPEDKRKKLLIYLQENTETKKFFHALQA